jgi:hypothetical protein
MSLAFLYSGVIINPLFLEPEDWPGGVMLDCNSSILSRMRQKDCEFETSVGYYREILSQKTKQHSRLNIVHSSNNEEF